MSVPVLVRIVGAPVACSEGVKDSWRAVAKWVASQLKVRFGAEVHVQYYDLFDADRPPLPANAQLPLVMVNGEIVSMGGKISVPAIRYKIEEMLEQEKLPETKSAD